MTTETIYFLVGLAVGWLGCGLLVKWKIRRKRRKSKWRRLKE
jgi:uncharacterized membrane protein YciS (DUF1049 family)